MTVLAVNEQPVKKKEKYKERIFYALLPKHETNF